MTASEVPPPELSRPEFSRIVDVSRMGSGLRQFEATPQECAALARRFALVSIDRLEAEIALEALGPVITATGRMRARIIQNCAVSGDPLPVGIDVPLALRFVPARKRTPDEEVELDVEDCDEIEFTGGAFDLGEEVAQSLALAIDPFASGPLADQVRKDAGILAEGASGPFAALAALTPKR